MVDRRARSVELCFVLKLTVLGILAVAISSCILIMNQTTGNILKYDVSRRMVKKRKTPMHPGSRLSASRFASRSFSGALLDHYRHAHIF